MLNLGKKILRESFSKIIDSRKISKLILNQVFKVYYKNIRGFLNA